MPNNTQSNNNLPVNGIKVEQTPLPLVRYFPSVGKEDPILNNNIKFCYPASMPLNGRDRSKIERMHWLMSKAYEIPIKDIDRAPLALRYINEALFQQTRRRDFVILSNEGRVLLTAASAAKAAARIADICKECYCRQYDPANVFNPELLNGDWTKAPMLAAFMEKQPYHNMFEALYLFAKCTELQCRENLDGNEISMPLSAAGGAFEDIYSMRSQLHLTINKFRADSENSSETEGSDAEHRQDAFNEAVKKLHNVILPLEPSDDLYKLKSKWKEIHLVQSKKRQIHRQKTCFTYKNSGFDNGRKDHTINQLIADFCISRGEFMAAQAYLSADAGDTRASNIIDAYNRHDDDHIAISSLRARHYNNAIMRINNYGVVHNIANFAFIGDYTTPALRFLEENPQLALPVQNNGALRTVTSEQLAEIKARPKTDLFREICGSMSGVDKALQLAASDLGHLRFKITDSIYNSEDCLLYDYDVSLMNCKAVYTWENQDEAEMRNDLDNCKKCVDHEQRSGAYALEALCNLRYLHFAEAEQAADALLDLQGEPLNELPIVTKRNMQLAKLVKVCARNHVVLKENDTRFRAEILAKEPEILGRYGEKYLPQLLTMPSKGTLNCIKSILTDEYHIDPANIPQFEEAPEREATDFSEFSESLSDNMPHRKTGTSKKKENAKKANEHESSID